VGEEAVRRDGPAVLVSSEVIPWLLSPTGGGEPATKSDHKTDGAKRGGGVDLLRFYFYLDSLF